MKVNIVEFGLVAELLLQMHECGANVAVSFVKHNFYNRNCMNIK